MNSIRSFVAHLLCESGNIQTPSDVAEIALLDSSLLENGCIYNRDDLPFFYKKDNKIISWVFIFEGRPYFVSGFGLNSSTTMVKVVVHLREIKVGEKLPCNLQEAKTELVLELMHFGPSIRLADCPIKTFSWLRNHRATKKVIERISRPA